MESKSKRFVQAVVANFQLRIQGTQEANALIKHKRNTMWLSLQGSYTFTSADTLQDKKEKQRGSLLSHPPPCCVQAGICLTLARTRIGLSSTKSPQPFQ